MAEDHTLIDLSATAGPARASSGARLERGAAIGRYMVLELLGEGGMGVVYAAYDADLDRKVALKLLRRSDAPISRTARARLLREARAMAKLHHPNVVTVYEVGTAGEEDFVAMQYVDGANLSRWLERGASAPTRSQILDVFRQAGRGLAAAHRSGMIHRDFKPANVLVDSDGRVRVTDFGLAQRLGDEDAEVADGAQPGGELDGLTHTGAAVGTPAYMAPEQFLGLKVDERTDQFGFCVSLYEALYHERPFTGTTYDDVRDSVVGGNVCPEPEGVEVPAHLRRVLLRGLDVDPDRRYPSMEALLADLDKAPKTVRRLALATGLLAVAGVVVALAMPGAKSVAQRAAQLCPDPSGQLAGVWDDDVRARVRTAFDLSRVPSWEKAFDGFRTRMDSYAKEWAVMYSEACMASRVRGEQSEEQFILRMGCLQERRAELASLASVFTEADATAVEQAVQAAEQGLPSLALCADLDALESGIAAPSEIQFEDVERLRERLTEVRAFEEAGKLGRALEAVNPIVREAREVGYAPLVAEALYRQGEVHASLHHPSEARAAFQEAIVTAEESQHELVRAKALVGMTRLAALFSSNADDARMWGRRASAAIKRYGRDPEVVQGRLNEYLAHVLREEKRYDESLALMEETRKLYELRLGPKHVRIGSLLMGMGSVQLARGWHAEALEHHREALFLFDEQLGADHPKVAVALQAMAECFRGTAQYDEAREYAARAKAFWTSERGQEVLAVGIDADMPRGKRVVRGTVVGVDGQAVAGAEVVIGQVLMGDGAYLYADQGPEFERGFGVQRTASDAAGRFEFRAVSEEPVRIAAEHLHGGGRSRAEQLGAGAATETIQLRLRAVGEVRGRVTFGGEVRRGIFVVATESPLVNSPAGGTVAWLERDGTYEIDRLPEGAYELIIGSEHGDTTSMTESRTFKVKGGQRTVLDVDVDVGNIDVSVSVKSAGGGPIPTAQVILVEGVIRARTVGDFNKAVLRLFSKSKLRLLFVEGEKPEVIANVKPGHYSVCVVPIPGDYRDPDMMRKFQPKVIDAAVHCVPADVRASPQAQFFVAKVPPAAPL